MKKALLFGFVLALVCSMGFFSTGSAEEGAAGAGEGAAAGAAGNGPEFLKITNAGGTSNPAYLPHHLHQTNLGGEDSCKNCHHGKNEDGTQAAYEKGKTTHQKCSTCHNKDEGGISLDGKVPGMSPIQRAGHGRCQGCHNDIIAKDASKKEINSCVNCHNKHKDKVAN